MYNLYYRDNIYNLINNKNNMKTQKRKYFLLKLEPKLHHELKIWCSKKKISMNNQLIKVITTMLKKKNK